MQYFKGDDFEVKMTEVGIPISDVISAAKDDFFDDAFGCFVLGELLYDTNRAPLANAIPRNIFRETFESVFDSFVEAGTFESYLSVFRKVFGDDVEVTFTVPAPGKLQIEIVAAGFELSNFVANRIVDNEYVFDNVVDDDGNQIVFETVKGFQTQYELEQMLFEMVPDGIYTEITLTVGEEE